MDIVVILFWISVGGVAAGAWLMFADTGKNTKEQVGDRRIDLDGPPY